MDTEHVYFVRCPDGVVREASYPIREWADGLADAMSSRSVGCPDCGGGRHKVESTLEPPPVAGWQEIAWL